MKRKKIWVTIFISVVMFLLLGNFLIGNKNVAMFLHELDYKYNANTGSLARLSLELIDTDDYEKQALYYKEVVDKEYFRQLIYEYDLFDMAEVLSRESFGPFYSAYIYPNGERILDEVVVVAHSVILREYQVALLQTHQYERFVNEFRIISDNYVHSEIEEISYGDLPTIIFDDELNTEQLEVMLSALQNVYPLDGRNLEEQIINLQLQAVIYKKIGDEQSSEDIIEFVNRLKEQL